jgi:hypothetical protein
MGRSRIVTCIVGELETLTDLRKALTMAVNAYNMEKPHQNIPSQMSPITFEKSLQNNKSNLKVKIYDHGQRKMLKYG